MLFDKPNINISVIHIVNTLETHLGSWSKAKEHIIILSSAIYILKGFQRNNLIKLRSRVCHPDADLQLHCSLKEES